MIDSAIQYIEDNFGTKIHLSDLDGIQKMPIYLSKGYAYKIITLFNEHFLLMYSDNNEVEMISMIQDHILRVKNILNIDYPIIRVFNNLNTIQRKKMINEKISFIIPGRMIFIFELGSVFHERRYLDYQYSTNNSKSAQMTPSTQALFLYLITTSDFKSSMEKISKNLDMTKMSVSRGFNDLSNLGLIVRDTYERNMKFQFSKDKKSVWEEAQLYFVNPLYKTLKLHHESIDKRSNQFIISGESALSKFSMLSEPRNKVYGITKKKFKNIHFYDDELNIYDENPAIVQLFMHALPTINNTLHPLSLFLLLKDSVDSRIKNEIKLIIDNYFKNEEL